MGSIIPRQALRLNRALLIAAGIAFTSLAGPLPAAEPLAGRWLLTSQEVDGRKTEVDQLILRVSPKGEALEFAYSVPVNNIQFVSLRFSVRLDGTEGDVTNANGQKIGTVKVTKAGPSQYRIVLQGQGRPTASGTMTVSPDRRTLTSQSDSKVGSRSSITRMIQVFSRQQ